MTMCPRCFAGEKTTKEDNTESDKKKNKPNRVSTSAKKAQWSGEIEASLAVFYAYLLSLNEEEPPRVLTLA